MEDEVRYYQFVLFGTLIFLAVCIIVSMYFLDAMHIPSRAWFKENYLDLLGIFLSLIAALFAWYGPYYFSKAGKVYHLQKILDDPSRDDETIKQLMKSLALLWFSVRSLELLYDKEPKKVTVSWYITEDTIDKDTESVQLMKSWLDSVKDRMGNEGGTTIVRYILIDSALTENNRIKDNFAGKKDFWSLIFPTNKEGIFMDNGNIKFLKMTTKLKADICCFEMSNGEKIVQFRDDTKGSKVYFDIKFSKDKSHVKNVEKYIKDYDNALNQDNGFNEDSKSKILQQMNADNENNGKNNV